MIGYGTFHAAAGNVVPPAGAFAQGGLPLLSALEALGQAGQRRDGTDLYLPGCPAAPGSSLSQALHRQRTQVGDLAWVLAEGGGAERSASRCIPAAGHLLSEKQENQKALLQASLYPALVLGITGLLGLYFLWSILPLFGDLYASLNLPMSPDLRFFPVSEPPAPWAALAAAGGAAGSSFPAPAGLAAPPRWLLRCPGLTSLNRKFWEIRYLGLLSLLLRGGLALDDALPRASRLLPVGPLRLTASQLSRQVVAGRPFSHCAREGDRLFSPLTVEFLALGEESGNLSGLLMEAACILEQDFQSRLKQLKTLLEPALLLTLPWAAGGMLLFC